MLQVKPPSRLRAWYSSCGFEPSMAVAGRIHLKIAERNPTTISLPHDQTP